MNWECSAAFKKVDRSNKKHINWSDKNLLFTVIIASVHGKLKKKDKKR